MSDAVLGLGLDVEEVGEVARILAGSAGASFRRRTFTPRELAEAGDDAARLAGYFAAKEAAFKALGTGWTDGRLAEVLHDEKGAPRLELHGAARRVARTKGVARALVSVSRTRDVASATVVLTG